MTLGGRLQVKKLVTSPQGSGLALCDWALSSTKRVHSGMPAPVRQETSRIVRAGFT